MKIQTIQSVVLCFRSSGVGKTELAKVLSKYLFTTIIVLLKSICNAMERYNVSRLIGAPPGYIGYEEGGQLTERFVESLFCGPF